MMNPDDQKAIDRIRAGGATAQERDFSYRAEHGQLTDGERATMRADAEAFIHRNRWVIRRRTLAAWLWGATEGMTDAWRFGRWLLYVAVVVACVRLFVR